MTPAQRAKALNKRDGHRCAWCGDDNETLVPHHRVNRGMGGSPKADNIANLVWLCSSTNSLLESDANYGEMARIRGIKLRMGQDPAITPIKHSAHNGWVLLTVTGTIEQEPAL